jgi:hypothetical protein
LVSAGSSIVGGLVRGISSQIGAAASAAARMAAAAISAAKSALHINSPSKVFQKIGLGVGEGLVLGLEGSKAQVQAASRKISGYIVDAVKIKRITSGMGKWLTRQLRIDEAALVRLANSRAAMATKISAASKALADAIKTRDDYKATVRAATNDLGNVTRFVDSAGGSDATWIIDGLKDAVAQATRFGQLIAQLKKSGLSNTALKQLVDKGVEGGLNVAQALVDGGKETITEVNRLQGQLDRAGSALGTIASNSFYGAGVSAAQGLLKGLQSQQAALTAATKKIADQLVAQIKKALRIHSPSLVMRDLGAQVPAGFALGIDGGGKPVDKAMSRLVDPSSYRTLPLSAFDLTPTGAGRQTSIEGNTFYNFGPEDLLRQVRREEAADDALHGAWGG